MKPSIPDNFVTLATAVEIAAEDWFPGDYLRTYVDPREWQQASKVEIKIQDSDPPVTPGSITNRSLLHSVEVSTPHDARLQTLQERLNDRQQLLLTVWRRFRQLLYWGELPSKILTDSERIEDIPAPLWLGEFGNRAYAGRSNGDPVAKIHVSVGDKTLQGYVIIEAAELWKVISAPQLCRAAFRPVDDGNGRISHSQIGATEPQAEHSSLDSSAVQDAPLYIVSIADTAPVAAEKKRRGRGRAQRMRAERVLSERFPNGIPEPAEMGNKNLVLEVRKHLPKTESISDQTILRAASRKR